MKNFDNGVSYYTHGKVDISFPEDDVCCYWCHLMGIELKTDRAYCKRTGEYLLAPRHTIGYDCPINFKEANDG